MSTRRDLCDALRALDPVDVPGFLTARSGLPGPRGNLELLAAFGAVAPESLILEPPAYLLHRWTPQNGLVSHQAYIGDFPGPYPFD